MLSDHSHLVISFRLFIRYFDEISQDTGKYCFGVQDTLKALELGAVETLIVWEDLTLARISVRNNSTGETNEMYLTPEQQTDTSRFVDRETGREFSISRNSCIHLILSIH